jgi:hypothetical protein
VDHLQRPDEMGAGFRLRGGEQRRSADTTSLEFFSWRAGQSFAWAIEWGVWAIGYSS